MAHMCLLSRPEAFSLGAVQHLKLNLLSVVRGEKKLKHKSSLCHLVSNLLFFFQIPLAKKILILQK